MTLARVRFIVGALCLTLCASNASAQVFGTFSWQMQPYCNVITLTVTQFPLGYTLDGNDNQCGSGTLAAATGQVLLNPSGTLGINFAIVTSPGGKAVHVAAVVSPASGSGTWSDSVGNGGNFVLAGAVPGLPPRPLPASGVGPATITAIEVAPGAIGSAQIAAGAVTGANVADASLTSADLLDGSRAAFISGDQFLDISGTQVVRSLTINAPAAGKVVVFASGIIGFTGSTTGQDFAICSITTGTTVDFAHQIAASDGGVTVINVFESFAGTRGFNVAAGAFTVNLACQEVTGSIGIGDSILSAIFTAQ